MPPIILLLLQVQRIMSGCLEAKMSPPLHNVNNKNVHKGCFVCGVGKGKGKGGMVVVASF